jgi:hypothetical protein
MGPKLCRITYLGLLQIPGGSEWDEDRSARVARADVSDGAASGK